MLKRSRRIETCRGLDQLLIRSRVLGGKFPLIETEQLYSGITMDSKMDGLVLLWYLV